MSWVPDMGTVADLLEGMAGEVEWLRSQANEWRRVAVAKQKIIDGLRDGSGDATRALIEENAELRDLVRDLWPHVRHRARYCHYECELEDECGSGFEPCLLYGPFEERMRALGIGDG